MKDLARADITYENHFPANICKESCFVVQIPESGQGVVLYTCSKSGKQTNAYLPMSFNQKYTNDIYVFGDR